MVEYIIESSQKFVFSKTTEISLKDKFVGFHGILPRSHLTGGYLEDAVASSLNIDPELRDKVDWYPGSHNPKSDIILNDKNIGISVKSGTIDKGFLKVSGNRLSKSNGDFNKINALLTEYVSDIMICFIYNNFKYSIYYVDREYFVYPTSANFWKPIMGKRNGVVSEYLYNSPSGIIVKILPKLSWQVWWNIPLELCRVGFEISIPK